MIKTIIYVILAGAALGGLFYLLSWVQMRAWLSAADNFFNDKITEYLIRFKNKADERKKEE